jgi:hypothetical protein
MKRKNLAGLVLAIAAMMMILTASPAISQDMSTDNMQILLDKVKADKKLLVAANMQLSESVAKGFWPVYEDYQKDLMAINERIASLIVSYADSYGAETFTNEKAKALTAELVSIQILETELQSSYVPKLNQVLSPKQVLVYMQIENKIRAAIKYGLAAEIPLAE